MMKDNIEIGMDKVDKKKKAGAVHRAPCRRWIMFHCK